MSTRPGAAAGYGDLEAVADGLVAVEESLDALREQIQGGGGTAAPAAVEWARVDSGEAADVLEGLAAWVEEVVAPTWPKLRAELVTCWPRHPDVVQVLLDLRRAWGQGMRGGAPASIAWDVHTRWVPHVLGVAQETGRRCRAGGHEPVVVGPPEAPDGDVFDVAADDLRG